MPPSRTLPSSSGPDRDFGRDPGTSPLPSWIARVPARAAAAKLSGEAAAFHAGAALSHLQDIAMERAEGVPMALLRDRLALGAVEAGLGRSGAGERRAGLRDRLCFLPAGAAMDPATARLSLSQRAVGIRLRGDGLARLGAEVGAGADGEDPLAAAGGGAGGDPVARAAAVLARVRASGSDVDAGADAATLLADAVLARALGWPALLPLLSTGLGRRDLAAGEAAEGAALRHACRLAILREAPRVVALAADLARRAERLRAVAPKLRAKASDAAVALFLARDAVAPTMDLTPVIRGSRSRMSPRAAARLCDRLVDLGVVRELTGRATFRLYGL